VAGGGVEEVGVGVVPLDLGFESGGRLGRTLCTIPFSMILSLKPSARRQERGQNKQCFSLVQEMQNFSVPNEKKKRKVGVGESEPTRSRITAIFLERGKLEELPVWRRLRASLVELQLILILCGSRFSKRSDSVAEGDSL
jgi:hypothetical protein